ncbi:MAG: IclR family transcriptional regulator, regulon repressor [Ilumatobacteraceae bacterium]
MSTNRRESPESAVARALALLTTFTFTDPVLGVSELGRRVKLPKSTVHRLLSILVDEGFVERTADDRYRLSLKLYEIGQEVVSSRVLRQVGHVPLERLHNDSSEAAHLAVLSGADVVYLDRLESPQMMSLFTKVGRRRSAHATSSGKVLLAYGTQEDVDDAVAAGLPRLGPRTITTRTRLNQVLADVRKAGYAISTDESAPGVVSIAAPIFDRLGSCVAAVSVAGPLIRMPADRHDKLVRMVVRTAAEISKALVSDQAATR